MPLLNKLILSCGILCALSGCATSQHYAQHLRDWQGDSLQHLRQVWGEPTSAARLPNGHTIYLYTRLQQVVKPVTASTPSPHNPLGLPAAFTSYDGNFARGTLLNLYCRTWFEVDAREQIVSSRFQGNHCIAP